MKRFTPIISLVIVIVLTMFLFQKFGKKNELETSIDKKEQLIKDAEADVKATMKDPDSYEFVSFKEDIEKEQDFNKGMEGVEGYDASKPKFLIFKFTFRGKNSFNALVLQDVYVKSNNEYSFIEIESIEN
jgi:hypothetical protein